MSDSKTTETQDKVETKEKGMSQSKTTDTRNKFENPYKGTEREKNFAELLTLNSDCKEKFNKYVDQCVALDLKLLFQTVPSWRVDLNLSAKLYFCSGCILMAISLIQMSQGEVDSETFSKIYEKVSQKYRNFMDKLDERVKESQGYDKVTNTEGGKKIPDAKDIEALTQTMNEVREVYLGMIAIAATPEFTKDPAVKLARGLMMRFSVQSYETLKALKFFQDRFTEKKT